MVHDLGPIYDNIYFLIKHHQLHANIDREDKDETGWYYKKLGAYYGNILNLLLYTNNTFEPSDPLAHYDSIDIDEEANA